MNDTHNITGDSVLSTRREFAKRAAAFATSATLALPLVAVAQTTPPASRETTAPPNPAPSPTPAPVPDKLLDAYADVARERFGTGLGAEELERVRTDLSGNLRTSARLSQAKLANADEPDFIFKA